VGRLALAGFVPSGGAKPRGFALSPDGRWLIAANQDSDSIVPFAIDPATGLPAVAGAALRVPSPTCIAFAPPGVEV
jgi:6-phosphogluconolactonase